jgi:hypothetical protein
MPSDADQVRHRFIAERDYIQQYIDFVSNAADIPNHVIREINETLNSHGLSQLPDRKSERLEDYYSPTELEALVTAINILTPTITATATRLSGALPKFTPRDFSTARQTQLLSEWETWMMQHLSDNPLPKEIAGIKKYAINQAPEAEDDDDEITPDILRQIIEEAVRVAARIKAESRIAGLEVALEQFDTLKLVARAALPAAEINIMRQGSILLMTAFDAAIFDLFRIALRKNFFDLVGVLGKNEKVSLERIGSFGTFEAFRDQIIEEQLKIRYLKDLLLLDATKPETFGHLIELVLRRNLHVHNRGIVDERYMERDDKGNPRFNIYNLSVGDLATVNESYWQIASRLCTDCVAAAAAWADT